LKIIIIITVLKHKKIHVFAQQTTRCILKREMLGAFLVGYGSPPIGEKLKILQLLIVGLQ
jgi:hypothetical protein